MNEQPRNVTPEEERERLAQAGAPVDADTTRQDEPREWTGWASERPGRNFPWLGILLVLIGVALLIPAAFPNSISSGTVLLFAIGIALIAGWVFSRSWLAAIAGLLLLALGVAGLVRDLDIYTGPGTTALSLAAAFLLIWVISLTRNRRTRWPLVAAAVLGIIGLIQISGNLTNIPELSIVWPVVIIVVGILLLVSSRRQ
jgi:hypothetical protein